jgi:hypothetical protein
MFNISNFLQKFSKIEAASRSSKESLSNGIKKISGIDITPQDIMLENGILRLRVGPIARNEILMRKSKILGELNSSGLIVKDIR